MASEQFELPFQDTNICFVAAGERSGEEGARESACSRKEKARESDSCSQGGVFAALLGCGRRLVHGYSLVVLKAREQARKKEEVCVSLFAS